MPVYSEQKNFISWIKRFSFKDFFGVQFLLWSIFVFALALFFHFKEVLVETLEVDAPAPAYVVAQVDFEFPDANATMILRQEAIRDIGKIYKIPESEIQKARYYMEEELLQHPNSWRKETHATFNEMYQALDAVIETLENAHITDPRTLKKREEMHIPSDQFFTLSHPQKEHPISLPSSFWDTIKTFIQQQPQYKNLSPSSLNFMIHHLKKRNWSLVNDMDIQKTFKDLVEKSIPERYSQVKAGSRIVGQGDKVSAKHIAMLKAMKEELKKARNVWTFRTIASSLLFSLLVTICISLYFQTNQTYVFSTRKLFLYITIVILSLILAKVTEWLLVSSTTQWNQFVRYPILLPFTSILLCILLNTEISLFTTFYLTIVIGINLAVDHSLFLFMNLITGSLGAIFATHLKKRKEVFFVCAKLWVFALFFILSFHLATSSLFNIATFTDIISAAINLTLIALLLISLTPVFEVLFNAITDMVLMEYMDPTNALLKRLSIEAAGTYQHSLALGFISEHVANAIGANGLFCRVTTLYHDIGKLNTPCYYTENQMVMGNNQFDIHQLLTPIESAYIIKAHVQDGATLAKQYHLPQSFIDIIYQHHGTTLINYFYTKQVNELGGNLDDVNEHAFRYPGPKPQTKEAAIIMLADSIEAASRSLEDNSEEKIQSLINKIVWDKISDKQFDECPLTFQEISTIKKKFLEIIKATHHLRIKYPTLSEPLTS